MKRSATKDGKMSHAQPSVTRRCCSILGVNSLREYTFMKKKSNGPNADRMPEAATKQMQQASMKTCACLQLIFASK